MTLRTTLLFFGMLLMCCGPPHERVVPPKTDLPDQQMEDFQFVETEFGQPRWILRAEQMKEFKARDLVLVEGVEVDFFRSEQDSLFKTSSLSADSGQLRRATGDMRVWRSVVVTTSEGSRLLTGWLQWSKKAELISTTDTVLIVREDGIMRGIGLESDPELEHIRILEDVTGTLGGYS